jgi:hypothetical protein
MKLEASGGRKSPGVDGRATGAKAARPEQQSDVAPSIFDELRELERAMRHRSPAASELELVRGELAVVLGVHDRERDAAHQEALNELDVERVRRADRRAGVRGWISIAYRAVGVVGAGVVVADAAGLLHPSTGFGALIRWLTGSA